MAMLRRWLKNKKFAKVPWFLIADDDTIIKYVDFVKVALLLLASG
jgi:hypothetical protein